MVFFNILTNQLMFKLQGKDKSRVIGRIIERTFIYLFQKEKKIHFDYDVK